MAKRLFFLFLFSLFLKGSYAQAPKDNFTHYTELDGLPSNQVFEIYQDRFGFIWAGTLNGLTRYDGYEFHNYFQDIQDPNSLLIDVVTSIFEDSDNELWVGGIGMISKYNRDEDNFTNY
ncbi:MAG: histidine kinase, partial [Calditrichaeota bacterium]|nr:histidine kinase [Calditrichota bacterium]